MISKILLQKTTDTLPQYVVDQIKYFLNNDWKYVNISNDQAIDFFQSNPHPEFREIEKYYNFLFKEINGTLAADLFRFYYIYLFGGVVLDADAMIQVPIEEITKDYDFFTGRVNKGNFYLLGFFGASQNNKIVYESLKKMFDITIPEYKSNPQMACIILGEMYKKYKHEYKCKIFNEIFYENDGFATKDEFKTRTFDGEKVVMIHYAEKKIIPTTHDRIPITLHNTIN